MPSVPTTPRRGFQSFKLSSASQRNLRDAGYSNPRPVQRQTLPAALAGKDILGLAQTGSGKTAAFTLPIVERLLAAPRKRGPRALIVAPTRELARQIDDEVRKLSAHTPIRSVVLHGGVNDRRQMNALRRNPDVIVACPGRFLDLFGQGFIQLERIEVLVLDEADHMFDMGFLPDVRRILAKLPAKRQNLLFAATMPKEVRHLAQEILHDPTVVELEHSAPAKTIEHTICPVVEHEKQALLEHFISREGFSSAIVFTRTKHRAKRLAEKLDRMGHRTAALQGNMSQPARDRAMAGFRAGQYDILVATDIAARGIDVAQVTHVINYDIPDTPEAYTHRIGRTGRSERSGQAFTFVTREDGSQVRDIERTLGVQIPLTRVEGFEAPSLSRGSSSGERGRGRPSRGRSAGAGRPSAKRNAPRRSGRGSSQSSEPAHSERTRFKKSAPRRDGDWERGEATASPSRSHSQGKKRFGPKRSGPRRSDGSRPANGRRSSGGASSSDPRPGSSAPRRGPSQRSRSNGSSGSGHAPRQSSRRSRPSRSRS